MKYIVAGNFRQAIQFAKDQRWGRSEWRYIPNIESTFGIFNPGVWRCGNWYDRKDASDMMNALEARGATFHA